MWLLVGAGAVVSAREWMHFSDHFTKLNVAAFFIFLAMHPMRVKILRRSCTIYAALMLLRCVCIMSTRCVSVRGI